MYEPAAVAGSRSRIEFRLLGPLSVVVDGQPVRLGGPRQVSVLGRLVLSPGLVVSMDELVDSVWDVDAPARPDVAIRSYVSHLRRAIEPNRDRGDRRSCLAAAAPGYRLTINSDWVDATRYERLHAAGRAALGAGDARAAVADFAAAAALWRGKPCEGMLESDALLAYRGRMDELRLATTELWCEARLELGDLDAVIVDLEGEISRHPLRERLTELIMLAYYRAGRQSDALAACRVLRERLIEGLGVTPSRPIQELERRILTHDPSLDGDVVPRIALDSPIAGATERSTVAALPRGIDDGPAFSIDTDEVPAITATPSASGPDRQLVGRDHDLSELAAALEPLDRGRGATVVVAGPAGIGKTAIVNELADRRAYAQVVWARCHSYAAGEPLWAWGQLLDSLAESIEPELLGGVEAVSELSPTLRSALPLHPNVTHADPTKPEAPAAPAALFRPIVELVRRLSARSPIVLVVEDLHWADDATIELLSFATAALTVAPVAFVLTWRDADPQRSPALRSLAALPGITRLDLQPLDRVAVEQLVERSEVGDRGLARQILAETAGHPGYVADLLAGLGRPGATSRRHDGSAHQLEPSGSMQDRIAENIRTLHPEGLSVMQAAAVHGEGFGSDVLSEVVEASTSEVEEVLESARDAGVIVDVSEVPPAFRFVQPIVASTLLGDLSPARVARLHAALGHALWRRGRSPLELADHFARAGSAGSSILAARFAIDASKDLVVLDDVLGLEEMIDKALAVVDNTPSAAELRVELTSFAVELARLRGRVDRWRALREQLADSMPQTAADVVGQEAENASHVAARASTAAFVHAGFVGWHVDRGIGHQPDDLAGDETPAVVGHADLDPQTGSSVTSPGSRNPGPGRLRHARLAVVRGQLINAFSNADRAEIESRMRDVGWQPGPGVSWTTADLDRLAISVTGETALGRLDTADQLLAGATARCHRAGIDPLVFEHQRSIVRWEQGKFDEIDEIVTRNESRFVDQERMTARALAAAGRGDVDQAEIWLEDLVGLLNGQDGPSDDVTAAVAALVANVAGARDAAEMASAALARSRRRVVVGWGNHVIYGPTSLFQALAAAASGRESEARDHLAKAEQLAKAIGSSTWLARTLRALAAVLSIEDSDRADALLVEAAVVVGSNRIPIEPQGGDGTL